ncbi:Intraflagellar transport protein like [Heracleum sosnowskyi]|uniref:Intraflagellar transport protein like n=1 Tax=Heracleum sosnowskyi TaxID=360622 RepID=A0AAD8J0D8_9APIA|nr:Intraflagellar transport protein like [Heracleum sosnowskyi]
MGGMKVGTSCLNLSHHSVPHSSSSTQTLASSISSPSRRRNLTEGFLRCAHTLDRSAVFGVSSKIYRTRSCEFANFRGRTIRRGCSANMEAFSDEEFSKKIQDLAMRFQLSDSMTGGFDELDKEMELESEGNQNQSLFHTSRVEPPDWQNVIPRSIERKANSVEFPLSLRMIKKKKQWNQVGESACSPVNKAFSSMVFIIRELQSYTLQMRQVLFYEDLQGILVRVHKEMNASFVWLFQQVFSHTPTLMLYVMILLANYSVHSMASNTALAASTPPLSYTMESVSDISEHNDGDWNFDSSSIKTYSVSSSSGKTTSIGGNNGGGGKYRSVAGGTDGDGHFDGSFASGHHRTVVPDGTSTIGRAGEEESVSGQVSREEELSLWNSVVEEASRIQAVLRDESLDHETMQRFVSPVTAKIESDDYADYFKTELMYQTELLQEPSNALLLANYAQFLYLVAQDYDRAENYFKRASSVEPKDAEAMSKYASFLWQARKDLWAAEETYLEAISIDPTNSYYAANYAHFLWNTGGEDTCFPLPSPDSDSL